MNNSGGYSPKELHFDSDAQSKLVKGIDKICAAVQSTLGPLGSTVLIESPEHTHGITVTKDGVTVAKSISLLDPVENLAVRIVKQAAERTATNAGDGTTTAIVLTKALVDQGLHWIKKGGNKTEILRELESITREIISNLKKQSIPLTNKNLIDVATISANNDRPIGEIIAETYKKVGKNGIVTVEKSQGSKTYFETTKGIKFDRGYSSHLFINNHKKDECVLEDVSVLVCDSDINNILSIENVLKPIISQGKKLLIVAPCSQNVTNTLAANVMKNSLKLCAVSPPSFGYKQHELMQDIALSVGATYFSENTGDDLSLITFEDLGKAKKIIVGKDSTIILKDTAKSDNKEINDRVKQLKQAHAIEKNKPDKDFIMSRIASLTGGIGVIYVGGNTDLQQKELYDRVDDAVCAVRSAMEEGILPGGGLALMDQGKWCETFVDDASKDYATKSTITALAMLSSSLRYPAQNIFENAGYTKDWIAQYLKDHTEGKTKDGHGFDVKNNKEGNLMAMGIIDPLKVTKEALQNAVSVAVTILSTNAIVTMAREITTK